MLEQLAGSWLDLAGGGDATAERRRGLERAARAVIAAVEGEIGGDDEPRGEGDQRPKPDVSPEGRPPDRGFLAASGGD